MPTTLPALPRRNAPWTPLQRRTWLANQRRHRLLPAPVLRAAYPDLLRWDWDLPNPYKWNVWMSMDGGISYFLVEDYWGYGDARQFAPDGGGEWYYIVGIDDTGREITKHSNIVRPDDALLPPVEAVMVSGYDGQAGDYNTMLNLVESGPSGSLCGAAYITDWACADSTVVPHCIVSNREYGYLYSGSFPLPNAGTKGTVAYKILLPADGNYRGLCPFWAPYGDWGMSMLLIASGVVNGGADDSIYIQTPKGSYFTSSVIFPNDGNFHWLIYRWDADAGFYEISVDGLSETVAQAGNEDTANDWGEVMNFQSDAQSESAACINVISHVSWWDGPLTDFQMNLLTMS